MATSSASPVLQTSTGSVPLGDFPVPNWPALTLPHMYTLPLSVSAAVAAE